MDECCVSWPSAVHEHVEADRVKPRVCYKVPARTTDSQPMRRQDRGDVGDDLSSKMEEIRMDASGKGIAWLQKKVETMNQTELQLWHRPHGDLAVRWCQWVSYARPSWSTLPRRRVCWGKMFGLVRTSFQLLTVSLGSITEGV